MGTQSGGKKTATRKKRTSRRKGTGKPTGRPPWAPDERTRQLVRSMSSQGLPHVSIAANVGTTAKTLRKHCPDELGAARSELAKLTFSNLATYVRGERAIQSHDAKNPGRLKTSYVRCTGRQQLAAIRLMLSTVLRKEVDSLMHEGDPDALDTGLTINVLADRGATGEEDDGEDDAALDDEQARYDAVPDDDE